MDTQVSIMILEYIIIINILRLCKLHIASLTFTVREWQNGEEGAPETACLPQDSYSPAMFYYCGGWWRDQFHIQKFQRCMDGHLLHIFNKFISRLCKNEKNLGN